MSRLVCGKRDTSGQYGAAREEDVTKEGKGFGEGVVRRMLGWMEADTCPWRLLIYLSQKAVN